MMKVFVLYFPAVIVSVSFTSKIGRPEMSFTENSIPVNTSETVKSLPWPPSTLKRSRALPAVVWLDTLIPPAPS